MSASVRGVDALVASMDDAADQLADLTEGHEQAGIVLETAARDSSPRRTGALAGTVAHQVSAGLVSITAGSPAVTYAAAVHKQDPWIARTVDQRQAQVVDIYAEAVARTVDQIKGA